MNGHVIHAPAVVGFYEIGGPLGLRIGHRWAVRAVFGFVWKDGSI